MPIRLGIIVPRKTFDLILFLLLGKIQNSGDILLYFESWYSSCFLEMLISSFYDGLTLKFFDMGANERQFLAELRTLSVSFIDSILKFSKTK